MRRTAAVTILAMVMGVAVLSTQTTPVHACSAGPDFDPVLESDVIVEGRFLSWELAPEANRTPIFLGVKINMAVERVWKGAVSSDVISLVDRNTLERLPGATEVRWIGSSGSCGAFNFDPTGRYGIMGLSQLGDGTYMPSLLKVFFIADEPDGKGDQPRPNTYQEAIDTLQSHLQLTSLPALGTGPAPSTSTSNITLSVAALGVALLLASLSIRYMSRRPH